MMNSYFLDLPSLMVINLGFTALEGEYSTSCSLVMQGLLPLSSSLLDLPSLTVLTSDWNSFSNPRIVTLNSGIITE